jgi:hypothetical protein
MLSSLLCFPHFFALGSFSLSLSLGSLLCNLHLLGGFSGSFAPSIDNQYINTILRYTTQLAYLGSGGGGSSGSESLGSDPSGSDPSDSASSEICPLFLLVALRVFTEEPLLG